MLWPQISDRDCSLVQYSRFLEFVAAEIAVIGQDPSVAVQQKVLQMISLTRSHRNSSREILLQSALSSWHKHAKSEVEDEIWPCIKIGIHIWLGLEIIKPSDVPGARPIEPMADSKTLITWNKESSIQSHILHYFTRSIRKTIEGNTKVETVFTMAYLVNYYGLKVYWTSNLIEHLVINWKFKTICIYEHKICLWNNARFPNDTLLPNNIIEEALDTMNLLFPFDDPGTKSFLRKEGKTFYSLGFCGRDRVLDLKEYHYWQEPISELVNMLKEPPRGLYQFSLDKDRKNMLQFATFWIATIVAILTILSFMFGVLSTIYTKKSYDITVLQYKLALAQACSVVDATVQLPEFCS